MGNDGHREHQPVVPPAGYWPRLIRAEEHLASLRAEIDFWREGDVCRAIGKFDSTNEFVIRVEERIPPIARLPILIGDVANCLRSALDHLAFALVGKYDPPRAADPERSKSIYFPIHEQATTRAGEPAPFDSLAKVEPTVLNFIRGLQPYTRGQDAPRHPLAVIARLSNTDKHRSLLLTSAMFSKGGIFGLRIQGKLVRSTRITGVFRPGDEVVRFPLTVDEVHELGGNTIEDVVTYAMAPAGVSLDEPGMETDREVPEVLQDCWNLSQSVIVEAERITGIG